MSEAESFVHLEIYRRTLAHRYRSNARRLCLRARIMLARGIPLGDMGLYLLEIAEQARDAAEMHPQERQWLA